MIGICSEKRSVSRFTVSHDSPTATHFQGVSTMGAASGSNQSVLVEIDTELASFVTPLLLAQGLTLAKWVSQLAQGKIDELREAHVAPKRGFSFAERAILSALLLQADAPIIEGSDPRPWLSRSKLAERIGLSKVAVGHATLKLEEQGDLISKTALPNGRGPPPLVYSLTPKGAQLAYTQAPESEASMRTISRWEDLIGYPGKGEPKRDEGGTYTPAPEPLEPEASADARCVCGHTCTDHGSDIYDCSLCGCDEFEAAK